MFPKSLLPWREKVRACPERSVRDEGELFRHPHLNPLPSGRGGPKEEPRNEHACLHGGDHVGVAVRDLEAALKTRGLPNLPGGDKRATGPGRQGDPFARGPDTAGATPTPICRKRRGPFHRGRGEGLHHLAFHVDNVSEKLEILSAQGLELVDREPRHGLSGIIAFVHPRSVYGIRLPARWTT